MAAPQPGIGDWYRQKEGGALFEVVAFDDDDGTIEIQYFDGTVEERISKTGNLKDGALETADPPEDLSGPMTTASEPTRATPNATCVRAGSTESTQPE
jgi:hypothetical protein